MNARHRQGRHHDQGRHLSRRMIRVAVVGVATGGMVVAATGIGLAYWSSQGSGTGSANTGSASISLPTTQISVGGLYPGASLLVNFNVTNSSPSASVVLKTAVTSGPVTITSPGTVATGSSCDPSVVKFTGTVPSGSLAAGHTTTTPVSGTVTMGTGAGNQCQGATFSIPITVTAQAG